MSENEILEKLQTGSETAFSELVENYKRQVINTCYGLVHNSEDAEDIAQDVFIEVFRSVQNFRGESKISTWLYRIAVNRSLNHIRDNKKRKWFQSFEDLVKEKNVHLQHQVSESPVVELENLQRANILHEAIGSLPENQKTAFTLNKYEDLSYREIAEIMDVSVASVESLIHRAKTGLQKKLYNCYKKKCF
jgi:RNA polymerase sigma-70 factor (ECF subfamily)